MIQANELRVGNILQYYIGEDGVAWDNKTIDAEDIFWCEQRNENFNKVHKPIPFTSEILEKTGFVFITDWSIKENDGVVYRIDLGWLRLETGMMGYTVTLVDKQGLSTGVHCGHVHQLQNLYFALTGKELEIKL